MGIVAIPIFWVRRVAGVSNTGDSGSEDTGTRGLALIIADTSARVTKISWVSWEVFWSSTIESRIFLATPIMHSQEPPMWEEWAGLNSHLHLSFKKFTIISSPVKLVPQSDLSNFTDPCTDTNLLKALIKQEESSDSITSMCSARMHKQVNSASHRLLLATRVLRVTIV